MITLCKDRPELKPDTTSFNSLIDTLSKSKERDCEKRAEALLEKMQDLAENDSSFDCRPDQVVSPLIVCVEIRSIDFLLFYLHSPSTW